jgi:hypothetical protein
MYAIETLKRAVERLTGLAKVAPSELRSRLRGTHKRAKRRRG